MSTLSQLKSEEAELVADLEVYRSAVQAFNQNAVVATVQEFTIGRNTVRFRDLAQVTMAMASAREQLTAIRQQILEIRQSDASIQQIGGGGVFC